MHMKKIMDDVFYKRQLELAEEIAQIIGSDVRKLIVTEYLNCDVISSNVEYERRLSYSEIQEATRKERINVTIVYEESIPEEAIPKLNKIMACHYKIYENELWYSMKPERLDFYRRTEKEA